jgi:hypothetical protein
MNQRAKPGSGSITPRASARPAHVRAPDHWQSSAPPAPLAVTPDAASDQPGGRDPVRYGDWEYKGLAIDF